jgi:Rha family phage regulatory protein
MNIVPIKELGIYEKAGIIYANSKIVSKHFEKLHWNVLRAIDSLIESLLKIEGTPDEYFQEVFIYEKQNKQTYREFNITREGFDLLVMGFTGPKALQWKVKYIKAFKDMAEYILALDTAKLECPELTQAILEAHDELKHFHFSNEMDLLNRIVLGMSAKQYKHVYGLGKVKSIRPYLSVEQIMLIEKLQRTDIGLVLTEPDFQKRKRTLEWYHAKLKEKINQKQLPA